MSYVVVPPQKSALSPRDLFFSSLLLVRLLFAIVFSLEINLRDLSFAFVFGDLSLSMSSFCRWGAYLTDSVAIFHWEDNWTLLSIPVRTVALVFARLL